MRFFSIKFISQIIRGLRYNQCVDWWAFGVLVYEMVIGQSPFSGHDEDELFWSVCNEPVHYPRFLSKESKRLLELVSFCKHYFHERQVTNHIFISAMWFFSSELCTNISVIYPNCWHIK